MHLILSPAKSVQFERFRTDIPATPILLPNQAQTIMKTLSTKSVESLQQLHHISPALAQLNFNRNRQWQFPFPQAQARQAITAFDGDVYTGLQAMQLPAETLNYAQNHLSILSGLYGLLRPFDAILPYRLEMGTTIPVGKARNLYAFWGSLIGETLQQRMTQQDDQILVNLASAEYFKALRPAKLAVRILTPEFKQRKNKKLQMTSIYAKRARGLMARFILENRLTHPDELLAFSSEEYYFSPRDSKPDAPVFVRDTEAL